MEELPFPDGTESSEVLTSGTEMLSPLKTPTHSFQDQRLHTVCRAQESPLRVLAAKQVLIHCTYRVLFCGKSYLCAQSKQPCPANTKFSPEGLASNRPLMQPFVSAGPAALMVHLLNRIAAVCCGHLANTLK